jgi:anti-sigma B factor antagonist
MIALMNKPFQEVSMKTFSIRSRLVDRVVVIYPKGHLDAHNVERIEKEILKHVGNQRIYIVINCRDLNYISSAGMGIIIGYLDEIREKGGDIKLCDVSEQVYEIFDLVDFTAIYDFLKSEEVAIHKFINN